ncbi:MAG: DUF6390 family protein [Candidatus Beckwithbacteria bacterium]
MQGLLRCSRYGLAPNKLKYCGPDKNKELEGYLKTKTTDWGLERILKEFKAMQPYLKLIARENGIADEFDERVVEAYWLGNELLDKVSLKGFFDHALGKLDRKSLKWFEVKLGRGAKPNHSFHVFNFWKRTGYVARLHTIETMDNCRISCGKVIRPMLGNTKFLRAHSYLTESDETLRAQKSVFAIAGRNSHSLLVNTDRLVYKNGKLGFEPAVKEISFLEGKYHPEELVTFHWNMVCEKINKTQKENLDKYTRLALNLANLTV